jgi:Protein of unknown function (DUF742)
VSPLPADPPWGSPGPIDRGLPADRGQPVDGEVSVDGEVPVDGELRARPYLVTGGRTRASDSTLSMETVVVSGHGAGPAAFGPTAFERGRILAQCRRPASVAEIAARLQLPLTVALVLVGDLVGEGHLLASSSTRRASDDIDLIERLIAGVTAL